MRLAFPIAVLALAGSALAAPPVLTSVVNAASYTSGPLSPGSIGTVFGTDLATTTAFGGGASLPVYLGNATVYVNGVASPLLYVSPTQVNFQVPWEAFLGQATVVMIVNNVVSNQLTTPMNAAAPGLFSGAVRISGTAELASTHPAHAGEWITIYATGLGPVDSQAVTGAFPADLSLANLKTAPTVTIGGVSARVDFAGLASPGMDPFTIGVYRVNALVPAGVTPADSVPVVVAAGTAQSNSINIPLAAGRADSLARYTLMAIGNAGVIARVVTTQNTCPSITVDGAAQTMQTRAAPSIPLFPVLTCDFPLPPTVKAASIEGQALALPTTNPTRLTVIGDTGCRMDTTSSQACSDPIAWPVKQVAQSALGTNPQLLFHMGDFFYRDVQCRIAACAGSPWGPNFDVWREDWFKPFAVLHSAAPWIFARGNHETCDRAADGWFRFFDPRAMPATCTNFTDPYAIELGNLQIIHLDSAGADDPTATPDPALVATYTPQFAKITQMAGPNAWIVTHRPMWGIRTNANSNVVMQAASQNTLPPGVQLVLSGHTHNFQAYSFSIPRAPQLVTGNGGDNLGANPTVPIAGFVLGNAAVAKGTSQSAFGFSTFRPTASGGWAVSSLDTAGVQVNACTLQALVLTCDK